MRRGLAIVVPLLLAFFLWPRPPASAEDRIRESINDAAEAIRRAQVGDFMDEISEDFTDPRFTRKGLHGMLLRELLNGGGTAVHLGPIEVDVSEDRLQASAWVTATFPGAFLETTLKATELSFELGYRLEDGDWKIVSQSNSAND